MYFMLGGYTIDNYVAVFNGDNVGGVDFVFGLNTVYCNVSVDYRNLGFGVNLVFGLFSVDYYVAILNSNNNRFVNLVLSLYAVDCNVAVDYRNDRLCMYFMFGFFTIDYKVAIGIYGDFVYLGSVGRFFLGVCFRFRFCFCFCFCFCFGLYLILGLFAVDYKVTVVADGNCGLFGLFWLLIAGCKQANKRQNEREST